MENRKYKIEYNIYSKAVDMNDNEIGKVFWQNKRQQQKPVEIQFKFR